MAVWLVILIVVAVALIVWLLASLYTRRKDIRKVAYMMDALEDGELNFRFKDSNKFNRTLNRIRTIFETQRQAHEQDSWTKLIRVLTHEIMNTVSPIASLSDAMARSVDETAAANWTSRPGWRPSATPPRTSSASYRPTGSFPAWPGPSARPWTCRN